MPIEPVMPKRRIARAAAAAPASASAAGGRLPSTSNRVMAGVRLIRSAPPSKRDLAGRSLLEQLGPAGLLEPVGPMARERRGVADPFARAPGPSRKAAGRSRAASALSAGPARGSPRARSRPGRRAPSLRPAGSGETIASVAVRQARGARRRLVSRPSTIAPARRPGSSIAASTIVSPSTRIARFSPIPSS